MKHEEIVERIIDRAALFKADTIAAYGKNFGSSSFPRRAVDAIDRIHELAVDLSPAKTADMTDLANGLIQANRADIEAIKKIHREEIAEIERRHESRRLINRIKAFFRRGKNDN